MFDIDNMSLPELQSLKNAIETAIYSRSAAGVTIKPSEFLVRVKAENERLAAEGKALILKALTDFMAEHPEVESLQWTQYTPYFNDGDACEFGVTEPEVKLSGRPIGDEDEEYLDSWSLGYEAKQAGKPMPPIADALRELHGLFGGIEKVMQVVFGEHARITVGRDGVAPVEQYNHD